MTTRDVAAIGILFPHDVLADQPSTVGAFARGVEDIGFDYLAAFDHVVGAPREALAGLRFAPYSKDDPFIEVLMLLAFAAAHTTILEISPQVLVLPQRQTVLAAKQLSSLQALSQGRLRLGVGVGWNSFEFAALGVPFGSRGDILDEQVQLLRRLWAEDLVEADGAHHRWSAIGVNPRPSARIPIWFGGSSLRAVDRAARLGDGFSPSGYDATTGASRSFADVLRLFDERLAHHGRRREDVGVEARVAWRSDGSFRAAVLEPLAQGATHLTIRIPAEIAPTLEDQLRTASVAWRLVIELAR